MPKPLKATNTILGRSAPPTPAANLYKQNGKYYYKCGVCGIVAGGNPKMGFAYDGMRKHYKKAHP